MSYIWLVRYPAFLYPVFSQIMDSRKADISKGWKYGQTCPENLLLYAEKPKCPAVHSQEQKIFPRNVPIIFHINFFGINKKVGVLKVNFSL